ncbi:hypothetical protein [Asanoa siamensis]|uniref:Uncharacterized protein n=1 Tax=Asanoa siamensis TaxID=926357 RepID=A0ABQ4CI85_9ACTN|nr:hypothetical protein [Asanoa siamensis]GIF70978.1 hypothetical protein Asi02nite_04960 [Asanoa siamensis]
MALRITDTLITSTTPGCDSTAHLRDGAWQVTSHPGRRFNRNQAITAMTLAEVYAANPPREHRIWLHVTGWRRELGLGDDDPRAGAPCRS